MSLAWLVLASLFFYGWWNPKFVLLLLGSILGNYAVGSYLCHVDRYRRVALWIGVLGNLGLLGYFKYANFLIENITATTGYSFSWTAVILPIGISFYTFQQLAYIVDSYRRLTKQYDFLHFSLFVTFFPQLIAGPIVHHSEMLPQFMRQETFKPHVSNLIVGFTLFFIGLFKKSVIADGVAPYSTTVFEAAAQGGDVSGAAAWLAVSAFCVQVYFDFSGYSDMAVGLARLFGIRLPFNFYSPLKAVNIIDFWRRWHMSLTRFITGYVFNSIAVPLMRFSIGRRLSYWPDMAATVLLPTFITFIVVGIWHGAGWKFVLFGSMHGAYIVINYVWIQLSNRWVIDGPVVKLFANIVSRALMVLCFLVSLVPFRADNSTAINEMFVSMIDFAAFLPSNKQLIIEWQTGLFVIFVPFLIAVTMPNSQQIMGLYRPGIDIYKWQRNTGQAKWWQWRMTPLHSAVSAAVAIIAILSIAQGGSEFLYFEF